MSQMRGHRPERGSTIQRGALLEKAHDLRVRVHAGKGIEVVEAQRPQTEPLGLQFGNHGSAA